MPLSTITAIEVLLSPDQPLSQLPVLWGLSLLGTPDLRGHPVWPQAFWVDTNPISSPGQILGPPVLPL